MGSTYHVYPTSDLVEHDTESEDCVCGPTVEHVPSENGDGWIVLHHSLDGREIKEKR
ncbi:MAG: hypothetical protein ACTH6A_06615 [Brachybacterium tyrofermentans]|uniref:hypothetical protein n=1 Tax=Brachybacterium tyrofermentans TaxID=47848 RepID=UPI003F8E117F